MIPVLQQKAGGYNILTIGDEQFNARGEDALINLIQEHFDEIRGMFKPEDFEITENKAYAEFHDNGERTMEVEPDEEFETERTSYEEDEEE